MNILDPADWTFPIPLAYGPGRLDELASICADAGMTNPLVVTDRNSSHLPFIGRSMDVLRSGGLGGALFDGISPNPLASDIADGREVFRKGGHDGVVAIGGGSGMDGGKAISLVANNDIALHSLDYAAGASPTVEDDALVPVVCVPTTAGTGAETESTAMITDAEAGVKICVWHSAQHPAAAILDPELTVGLPPHLTAWTGVDALVHAIEAYSVDAWSPLCDGLAIEAITLIWPALPRAVADGSDLEARASMLVGSCLAGISFVKGLGLVHAMSHMVGAVYDTHHGLTNAVLLPPVLEFNKDVIADKASVMATQIGLDEPSIEAFQSAVDGRLAELEIPTRLSDIGVGDDRLDEIALKAIGDSGAGTNPRPATHEQVKGLLLDRL